MTTTLSEYAEQHFPGHDTEPWGDRTEQQLQLSSHTVVVHVVGTQDAAGVVATMQRHTTDPVAAVVIKPVSPSVIPDEREDSDGVFDLPRRRVVTAAAGGALLGGAASLVAGIIVGGLMTGLVLTLFGMAAGATVAAVWGGGARHASERAVSQPQAPGRNIAIVAAFLHDEGAAMALAQQVSAADEQYDVRIVGPDGAWHAPNN